MKKSKKKTIKDNLNFIILFIIYFFMMMVYGEVYQTISKNLVFFVGVSFAFIFVNMALTENIFKLNDKRKRNA